MAEPGDPHQPDPDPVDTPEPVPSAAPRVDDDAPAVTDAEPAPALESEAESEPEISEPEPEPEPEPEREPEPEPAPEPEPVRPHVALHDDDAHVGFVSAASLAGRTRDPEPEAPATPAEPDPGLAPVVVAPAVDAGSTFALSQPFSRRRKTPAPVAGGMGLFTVYALILFAIPTFGVAAVIGLLAVTGRPLPEDDVARSHVIYQQRTLWAAAVVALLGAILIVVGVGVFVLFALAVWLPVRGAFGLWELKAGRAISNPRSWLI